MRRQPSGIVETGRVRKGKWSSDSSYGCNGAFMVLSPFLLDMSLCIIASSGADERSQGFEHVSVSCENRTPTWEEMQWVKEQFWKDDETCFQLHPTKAVYVNCHPFCLHIWRHASFPVPLPPPILVGPRT
jgi:hypothetical protein